MTATVRGRFSNENVGCLIICIVTLVMCVIPSFVTYRAFFPAKGPARSATPRQIRGLQGMTAVATGYGFGLALRNDGTVWGWGAGYVGQLAAPASDRCKAKVNDDCRRAPAQVPLPGKVIAVAAAEEQAAALTDDGKVWVWGSDEFSTLGNSPGPTTTYSRNWRGIQPFTYRMTPAALPSLPKVTTLAAGPQQFVVLTDQGEVWTWGQSGRIPTLVALPGPATRIAAGNQRGAAILADGSAWEWRLSLRPTAIPLDNVATLVLGTDYAIAITQDGATWFWGNGYGNSTCPAQRGAGSLRCANTPVQISELPALTAATLGNASQTVLLAIATDGQLWRWDGSREPNPSIPTPATPLGFANARTLVYGRDHALALKGDGTVWGWGDNTYGQIGR